MSYVRTIPSPPARGYTIIELMVSITVGLIILAALVTLFAGNSRERGEIERANQQTENGRYALQMISDDLRDAGYLATYNPGTVAAPNPQLTVPLTIPNACATDLPTLTGALSMPVQGFYQGANAPACMPADLRAGTDILVVRRASTCAVGSAGCDAQVAGDVYLQASGCNTQLTAGTYFAFDSNVGNLTLLQKDCATAAPIYQFRTHIYFVANNDKAGDGIPTLKRAELGPGAFTIVPLVEGVENLHLEYGLDTAVPTAGTPAVYTANPNTYNGCAPAACVSNWRNTVTVKINVLSRNLTTTQGYTDTKTYTLGLTAGGAANVVGPFNDGYKRHAYSTVAVLYNTAGRNSP
nr:hypothetical protein Hi04_10k_c2651_00021 [uncultured bacterium]